MISGIKHLFMCLLAIRMSSLKKMSIQVGLFVLFFDIVCMSSLYFLDINPLSVTLFANIISYSVGGLFILLIVPFTVQNLFSLM